MELSSYSYQLLHLLFFLKSQPTTSITAAATIYLCAELTWELAWQAGIIIISHSTSTFCSSTYITSHHTTTTVCFSAYFASFIFFAFVPLAKGIKCDGKAIIHLDIIPSQASKIFFAVFLQKNFYTESFSFWTIIIISISAHITSHRVYLSLTHN